GAGVWLTMSISSTVTGPARRVLVTPLGGVAQATRKAIAPKALTTKTAANVSFNVFLFIAFPSFWSARGAVWRRGGLQRLVSQRRCGLLPSERRTAPCLS